MQYPLSHEVEETVRGRGGQQVCACSTPWGEGEGPRRAAGAPGQEGCMLEGGQQEGGMGEGGASRRGASRRGAWGWVQLCSTLCSPGGGGHTRAAPQLSHAPMHGAGRLMSWYMHVWVNFGPHNCAPGAKGSTAGPTGVQCVPPSPPLPPCMCRSSWAPPLRWRWSRW